ncbi:MAG: hypothetical protein FJW39_10930 [Acidobacteria bacterium]|nr:hypothetical protein [Acidobacteriota bacterium]
MGGTVFSLLAAAVLSEGSRPIPRGAAYHRDGNPVGFVIEARVAAGAPMRLLFDTGAESVILGPAAATRSGVRAGCPAELAAADGRIVRSLRAVAEIEIRGLRIPGVVVDVAGHAPAPGVDGVFGAGVLQAYRVRLDGRRRTLEILPPAKADPSFVRVRRVGHALLAPVTVNRREAGEFLVDSGAAYSVLDSGGAVPGSRIVSLLLASGFSSAAAGGPAHFRVSDYSSWEREVIHVDLSALGRLHGISAKGLIGYPLLSRSVLTIDYANNRIHLAPR